MKIISWNVNGIRAVIKKGFLDFIAEEKPDIMCIQETKAHPNQVDALLPEYPHHFWNSAEKKGYAGTAIFSKIKPIKVTYGTAHKATDEEDTEGRVLIAEYEEFFLVNVYTINSKRGLLRLEGRKEWDKEFLVMLKKLDQKKAVIVCGDLNVAHKEIDLKNPKSNYDKTPGFTQAEIDGMDNMQNAGFIDTFRMFNKDPGNYTWWSYMFHARSKNVGWRIDYFLVSEKYTNKVKTSDILPDVMGSDHCPVRLIL
jgi:exodeoxyribonuclease III